MPVNVIISGIREVYMALQRQTLATLKRPAVIPVLGGPGCL